MSNTQIYIHDAQRRVNGSPGINTETRLIDATAAAELLASMNRNRPLSKARVEAMVSDMRSGRWVFDGAPIRVGANGELLDGQHRCQAIVQTGIAQWTIVVSGLESDSQLVMDSGRPRSFASQLHLLGVANAADVAAATSIHLRIENGAFGASREGNIRGVVSTPALLAHYYTLQAEIGEALVVGRKISNETFYPRGQAAALFIAQLRLDELDARYWVSDLCAGAAAETSAARTLNRWAAARYREQAKPQLKVSVAVGIKAWNAYREGREISALGFRIGGSQRERFPVLV
jgi:hypothetical protein